MSEDTVSQLKRALAAIKELRSRLDATERARTEPIAVIGMGCRFPGGANTPEQFWELLVNGVDGITETPKNRWNIDALYDPDPEASGKISSRWGGYLDGMDQLDPAFFGISPKEAALMDPQQRLLLEVTWEALEDAGQTREALQGSLTGVFVGVHSHSSDYYLMQVQDTEAIDTYTGTGTSHSVVGGRLSYLFDWHGPNVTLDTACSSSLVAIHLAVQSLRNGESNLALAAGVNMMLSPEFTIAASRMHMLSPDGRCKTFDQRADGFVRSEGCGVVVLKRLSDALADGDTVLALIRGSAVNQDGKSNGLTAPNGIAQAAVIRAALANSGVQPEEIGYIETHGTGTALGDPIEVEALTAVFGGAENSRPPCYLGSAKSNIGHMEGAAGVGGVIKAVLSLQHQAIPPLLHFTGLNPHISLDHTPFVITTEMQAWPATDKARLAGVSSFGWSGTNAHIVLQAAPAVAPTPSVDQDTAVVLPLSAHTPAALRDMAGHYAAFLAGDAGQNLPLNDMAYTLGVRRTHHEYRLAVAGRTTVEIAYKLRRFAAGESDTLVEGRRESDQTPRIVFVFPGQGGQWSGMLRGLMQTQPVFRQALEECDAAIAAVTQWSVLDMLRMPEQDARWEQIDIVQPLLFAAHVALAALWRSWGIEPDAILGHSLGEVSGAYIAGTLSLEDAARVICHRSRLMRQTSGQGAMAVVGLSMEETAALLHGYESQLSIAVSNSPRSTVISGDPTALEGVLDTLRAQNIFCRRVKVDVASHSPQMEPLRAELVKSLSGLKPRAGSLPIYSTVDGVVTDGANFTPDYWGRNLRQPVQFSRMAEQLLNDGYTVFIEISPHPILLSPIDDILHHTGQAGWTIPSLVRQSDEMVTMLQSLGAVYAAGVDVDWGRLYPEGGTVVQTPPYPWQRERFWMDAQSTKVKWSDAHPLLGQQLPTLAHLPDTVIWENHPGNSFQRMVQQQYADSSEAVCQAIMGAAVREAYGLDSGQWIDFVHHAPITGASAIQMMLTRDSEHRVTLQLYGQTAESGWSLAASAQAEVEPVQLDWLYEMTWQSRVRGDVPVPSEPGRWVIFADRSGVGANLKALLNAGGAAVTLVFPGEQNQVGDGEVILNPTDPEAFAHLFQTIAQETDTPLLGVLYLWTLDVPGTADFDEDSLTDAQLISVYSPLYLVQSLVAQSWDEYPFLWLVTQSAQPVVATDGSQLALGQSPIWGFGRTVSVEHSDLWGGLIDLPAGTDVTVMAQSLLSEVLSPGAEDQIAYRDGERYVARLVRSRDLSPELAAPDLHADATYLITGGLGGIGLEVAYGLARQGARHLVLMGRRGATDAVQPRLAELEAMGVQMMAAAGDVSNPQDMARVLAEIEQTMPPLRGVIHSAAVADPGVIVQQNGARYAKMLPSKIQGTWNLHHLTQNLPLDFFILFSSGASTLGLAGESGYAAGNAFLDAFSAYRRVRGLPGMTINWGVWGEIGLAVGLSDFFKKIGFGLMDVDKAVATLGYLMRIPAALHHLVADVDWQTFRRMHETRRERMVFEPIWQEFDSADAPADAVPEMAFADRLRSLSAAEQWQQLVDVVREEAARVMGFEANALDIRGGFFKIGMDSLMSVQLRNRLEVSLDCTLPPTIAFEYPTVESLARYIYEKVFHLGTTDTPAAAPETAAPAQLDTLSEDELASLLDDELAAIDDLIGDDE
ncbi:MAG: type I polyketide synthase [Anaerolineaceae bacterium]|nr:type I polyketide synthase [Anaerolineaceae bacterium]